MNKRAFISLSLPLALACMLFMCACSTSVNVPLSAESYQGLEPEEVAEGLKEAGFTNISMVDVENNRGAVYDGDVASVKIDGDLYFNEGQSFPSDANVIINCYDSYAPKQSVAKPEVTEESEPVVTDETSGSAAQGESNDQNASSEDSDELDPEFKATVDKYEQEFTKNLEDMKVESKNDGPEAAVAMLEYLQNSIGFLMDLGNQAVSSADLQYLNDAVNRIQQKASEVTNSNLSFLQSIG